MHTQRKEEEYDSPQSFPPTQADADPTRESLFPSRRREFAIPESGRNPSEVMNEVYIAAERSPNDYHSGQAFGKPGTIPHPIAVHAHNHMMQTQNPNNIDGHMFLGAYEMEKEVIAQTARAAGKTDEQSMRDGFMLSGATESIHQYLWMARNRYYRTNASTSEREPLLVDVVGMADAASALRARTGKKTPVILAAVDAHFSMTQKAPALLGMGRDSVRHIPLNDQFHISLDAVADAAKAAYAEGRDILAHIGTFGDTQKGRLEDIAAVADVLADVAARLGAQAPPIVVDAAAQYLFGMAMKDSPRHGRIPVWDFRVPGVEAIIADPHKNQLPYGCGLLLLRDQALARETHVEASYLSRDLQARTACLSDREREDAQINATIPTSRAGYNAAALWAYYQGLGMEGIRMQKEAIWQLAKEFADGIRESPHYELVMDPQSSVVSFRTKDHSGKRMAGIYGAINTSVDDKLYIAKSTTTAARTINEVQEGCALGDASPYTALHIHVMEHNRPRDVAYLLQRLDAEARR